MIFLFSLFLLKISWELSTLASADAFYYFQQISISKQVISIIPFEVCIWCFNFGHFDEATVSILKEIFAKL